MKDHHVMPHLPPYICVAFIHPRLSCFNLGFKGATGGWGGMDQKRIEKLKVEQKFSRQSKETGPEEVAWTKPSLASKVIAHGCVGLLSAVS